MEIGTGACVNLETVNHASIHQAKRCQIPFLQDRLSLETERLRIRMIEGNAHDSGKVTIDNRVEALRPKQRPATSWKEATYPLQELHTPTTRGGLFTSCAARWIATSLVMLSSQA